MQNFNRDTNILIAKSMQNDKLDCKKIGMYSWKKETAA